MQFEIEWEAAKFEKLQPNAVNEHNLIAI
jgi:hypothetical protein